MAVLVVTIISTDLIVTFFFFKLITNSHAHAGHLGNPRFYKEKCTA